MKKSIFPGINIQYPISRLILEGEKTIETRKYQIPPKYIGVDMLLIETPGKNGKFKSRIVGIIQFKESFKYDSKKHFYQDIKKHKVDRDSIWAWSTDAEKWGWPVKIITVFDNPIPLKKRIGIKFTKNIEI